MKKKIIIMSLFFLIPFLVACEKSFERAERAITLTQEQVTSIINDLGKIQHLERDLQSDFEATIEKSEDLSSFASDDSPIMYNLEARRQHLKAIQEKELKLTNLVEELENQVKSTSLTTESVQALINDVNALLNELTVYTTDYLNNIDLEKQTYQSIANPETDYASFFKVFDNINLLNSTNEINLERVLGYFEPLNTRLVNYKIELVKQREANQ